LNNNCVFGFYLYIITMLLPAIRLIVSIIIYISSVFKHKNKNIDIIVEPTQKYSSLLSYSLKGTYILFTYHVVLYRYPCSNCRHLITQDTRYNSQLKSLLLYYISMRSKILSNILNEFWTIWRVYTTI